ncbi:MAG: 3-hydroxyacyl-CoA dehydrogenase [Alphaproteobacteria bacterium]|nr:3-hydroxyacyl-CoA dehydrogenase [Alphaproteobacteria bacterium]
MADSEGAFAVTSMAETDEEREALALAHVAAAERAARTPAGIDLALARPVARVAIVGGGLMGSGIATACLRGGLAVTLIERDAAAAETAAERVAGLLEGAVKRGKMTANAKKEHLQRLQTEESIASAAGTAGTADLAIEAVFEDRDAKRSVFERLAAVLDPNTPIATNTSYLDPLDIAAGIDNPGRILGLHFFSPAHIMKLLEVVQTPTTSNATLATVFQLAERLGKIAVLSGICDGFIGNRMLQAYRRQADYMLIDGCLPHEVDHAMRAFGMPMGPYELQDLTGLQIAYANRQRLAASRDPEERYVTIADRLCEMGRLGQRAGRGWYHYEEGDRTPHRDDDVERLIVQLSAVDRVDRRRFSETEIQDRLLAALINEGGHILDEGIAARSGDIDLVKIHGYGFPRKRGGPMYYAENVGRKTILHAMQAVALQSPNSWRISRYLDAGR